MEAKSKTAAEKYWTFATDGVAFSAESIGQRWPDMSPPRQVHIFHPPTAVQEFRRYDKDRRQTEKDMASERLDALNLSAAKPVNQQQRDYDRTWAKEALERGRATSRLMAGAPQLHPEPAAGTKAAAAGGQSEMLKSLRYDMQLMAGAKPIQGQDRNSKHIVLDGDLRYEKRVREVVPLSPRAALATQASDLKRDVGREKPHDILKNTCVCSPVDPDFMKNIEGPYQPLAGHQRWVSLPAILGKANRVHLRTPTPVQTDASPKRSPSQAAANVSRSVAIPALGSDAEGDARHGSSARAEFQSLMREWCSGWKIALGLGCVYYATVVLEDMRDSRNQLAQCRAVALCAWPSSVDSTGHDVDKDPVTTYRADSSDGRHRVPSPELAPVEVDAPGHGLSKALVAQLNTLLVSPTTGMYVRIAALLSLCALDLRPAVEIYEPILTDLLDDIGRQHRWLGAQCAALMASDTTTITSAYHELFTRMQEADREKKERALRFLGILSLRSPLVRLLSTSALNSQSNVERLAVCELIPTLAQAPTLDVAHKLVYLHWQDPCQDVRNQATLALIATGHTKLIHDEIWSALLDGDELEKVAALEKMARFQLLTKRLMPAFLTAFKSPFTSVRTAAVNTAGILKITDDAVVRKVMNQLVEGTTKLKESAYQALCAMKPPASPELLRHMEWAVQLELDPVVKGVACWASATLCPRHPPVVAKLKALLEADEIASVKEGAAAALVAMGEEAVPERREMKQIAQELDELSEKSSVVIELLRKDRREKAIQDLNKRFRQLKPIKKNLSR